MRRASDATIVEIASGTVLFDVASANAGAAVGSYAANGVIPNDTYDAFVPLTVQQGDQVSISIQFDVGTSATFTYAGGACTGVNMADPVVTTSFSTS